MTNAGTKGNFYSNLQGKTLRGITKKHFSIIQLQFNAIWGMMADFILGKIIKH